MTLVETSTLSTLMWLIVAVTIAIFHGVLPVAESILATALCCFALPVIGPLLRRFVLAITPRQVRKSAARLADYLTHQRYQVLSGIVFFSIFAWIVVIVNFQFLFGEWPPLASLAIVVLCICFYALALIPLSSFFDRIHRHGTDVRK